MMITSINIVVVDSCIKSGQLYGRNTKINVAIRPLPKPVSGQVLMDGITFISSGLWLFMYLPFFCGLKLDRPEKCSNVYIQTNVYP